MNFKPTKICVPLHKGQLWRNDGAHLYQEKADGRFELCSIADCIFAGELMKTGKFIAFDIIKSGIEEVSWWPLRERWSLLVGLEPILRANGAEIVKSSLEGGKLLESVLLAGGEGVVAKEWGGNYFAPMAACKRLERFDCTITGFVPGSQSVFISAMVKGELRPVGKLKLGGGKVDRVRGGSILKIEAMGLTARGMLREARVCTDSPTSWLVKA